MEDWDRSNYIDYAHITPETNQVLSKYVTDIILKILRKEGS